jgi:hypothetical protein
MPNNCILFDRYSSWKSMHFKRFAATSKIEDGNLMERERK